tara:strand:+ start:23 stop:1018 length:996 start_codon:yes stop_codon:yes gene_type:complete
MKFYDGNKFFIEGIIESSSQRENTYDRLPKVYKNTLRKELWDLSKNSSGVAIKFMTDSKSINIKWVLINNMSMNHMPNTGIKGVDLYSKSDDIWEYVNTGIPEGIKNEQVLLKNSKKKLREYVLYLPLYEGTKNIQIGIDDNSKIKSQKKRGNSFVFYGTSLTQGGCASRPGLSYTNIISRKMKQECINLGFSGNGHLDESIAEILSSITPKAFIIECMANLDVDMVKNRMINFIKKIREKNLSTPIIFIEECFNRNNLNEDFRNSIIKKNKELFNQFQKMKNENINGLYIINDNNILNSESTVDGVHFNDLGSVRYANYFINEIKKLNIF